MELEVEGVVETVMSWSCLPPDDDDDDDDDCDITFLSAELTLYKATELS